MTEAWLLLDEDAIRRIAGRPTGRAPLGLPGLHEVERIADPKELLREVLLRASGTTGRRRDQFVRDFGRHRARLLELVNPRGPVSTLSAWRRLHEDIARAFDLLGR